MSSKQYLRKGVGLLNSCVCVCVCVCVWFIIVCIQCQIKVGPRMKDAYILNWRNSPDEHGMKRGTLCGRIEAWWSSPHLTAFGGFENVDTVPACQNSYTKFDLSCCSLNPATETLCLKPQILFALRKQSHSGWNPAISLAHFQHHVLPLQTGSSVRGEKCKWNVPSIFFFCTQM